MSFEHLGNYFPREMFYEDFYKRNICLSDFALFPQLFLFVERGFQRLSLKITDLRDIDILLS